MTDRIPHTPAPHIPGDIPGGLAARLRAAGESRPAADPALAGGLRAWLEDEAVTSAGGEDITVVDGRALVRGPGAGSPRPTGERWAPSALRQLMVRALFRQAVTVGPAERPFEDALAAVRVGNHGPDVIRALGALDRRAREELRDGLGRHAAHIAADWQPVPGAWLPRTADRMAVPLAGGRVVLVATADLVLGAPAAASASVCLLDIRAGDPSPFHDAARGRLALIETLRSGAAPFRVATYYSATGELVIEDVTESLLTGAVGAVRSALAAADAVAPVAADAAPSTATRPTPLPGTSAGRRPMPDSAVDSIEPTQAQAA